MADFYWDTIVGASKSVTARVRSASFGDGYEQRIQDGINNTMFLWEVSTKPYSTVIANAIEDFLILKGGATSFTWHSPDRGDVTVKAASWNKVPLSYNLWQISATFEQVYEL